MTEAAASEKPFVTIDRTRARTAFERFLEPYDMADPRIALKAAHTYRVASLCDQVARDSGFSDADADLAWLCGLLHDLGRFEQQRRWDTFADGDSANHAAIAVDMLFNHAARVCDPSFANVPCTSEDALASDDAFMSHARETGTIRAFLDDPAADDLILAAVAFHSDFRIPDGLDARTRAFCHIVRDADKIDILRVACTDTVKAVMGVHEDELLASGVSPTMERAFFEHRTATRAERTTPVDNLINLSCYAFELAYPTSLEIMVGQGYLFALFAKPFGIERAYTNRTTACLVNRMGNHLRTWIDEQLG